MHRDRGVFISTGPAAAAVAAATVGSGAAQRLWHERLRLAQELLLLLQRLLADSQLGGL